MGSHHLIHRGKGLYEWTLDGDWRNGEITSSELLDPLHEYNPSSICFVAGSELQWNSRLIAALFQCIKQCRIESWKVDVSGMPDDIQRLLSLASTVPDAASVSANKDSFFIRCNNRLRNIFLKIQDLLSFIGEIVLSLGRLVTGRSDFNRKIFMVSVMESGPGALGIVALISVLTGMILAYIGTLQLKQFGAEIYVSNLVCIGMLREMGALMTAVIMSGRTGAAYAAQLGTMQVNEEVDALMTLGIDVRDYLVIPRLLALIIMMPILTLYSNLLGIAGGGLVVTGMDISPLMYINQMAGIISSADVFTGLFKSVVFGVLIGLAGCQAGLSCGRSSAAVGQATTQAVVASIVCLVVADAVLNILYFHMGI